MTIFVLHERGYLIEEYEGLKRDIDYNKFYIGCFHKVDMPYSIGSEVERTGEFPREADPCGWFSSFAFILYNKHISQQSLEDYLPQPINLEKFRDNPGFYLAGRNLLEDIPVFSPTYFHAPFMADTDEEAIEKLNDKIEEINAKYSHLFFFGKLVEAEWGNQGILQLMAEHPEMAREIENKMKRDFACYGP